MSIIDTFLRAPVQTQGLILGIDIVTGLLLVGAMYPKRWPARIVLVLSSFLLTYHVVWLFASRLPMAYFSVLYIVPSTFMGLLFHLLGKHLRKTEKVHTDVFDVEIPYNRGKLKVNIRRGVSVQGASGSGKTLSVAGWILRSMGENNVPGLIYDYKDFELVEAVQWFYRESDINVHAFAPHDPDRSIFLNPIDPAILKREEDITLMSKCIVQNLLTDRDKGDNFFVQAAEGAITGCIHVLREKYPEHCSFPFLAAVFLTKETEGLIEFIQRSPMASIHARAFLDGRDAEKQMAGVKASLSNAFRVFAIPNIFYSMRENSIGMNINDKGNRSVLCLVNTPRYDDIYSPILSITAQAAITAMSERGQGPCYLLLDEAPTLRINRIGRLAATMRSFDIATIYMLQDKVQAQVQMGTDRMKEVLANLSTLFFGKTNDPDTARFFESYFETVKVKTRSTSKKTGWVASDTRVSESEKEEKAHRSHEMFKRKAGEFFVFDEKGNGIDARIKIPELEPFPSQRVNIVTDMEIKKAFEQILEKARNL